MYLKVLWQIFWIVACDWGKAGSDMYTRMQYCVMSECWRWWINCIGLVPCYKLFKVKLEWQATRWRLHSLERGGWLALSFTVYLKLLFLILLRNFNFQPSAPEGGFYSGCWVQCILNSSVKMNPNPNPKFCWACSCVIIENGSFLVGTDVVFPPLSSCM